VAVLFYLFIYVFMFAAAFGMILLLGKGNGFGEEIAEMRGLARKSPMAAAGIIILLLSLTGIPPTAGFFGKYFLFAAAVEKGMTYLAVLGALNSVISLFFYFRIGKAMFMEEEAPGITIDKSFYVNSVLIVSALVIIILGILPSLLTAFATASALP
jgi:NADH-quinone oxidoreductase subunit N